ncbi:hypothetical protein F5B21DRAFT_481773 [Xylaria acuta]|nr:hypothetical protein F5B21DRAFT_481773 [Xylaria acuta]
MFEHSDRLLAFSSEESPLTPSMWPSIFTKNSSLRTSRPKGFLRMGQIDEAIVGRLSLLNSLYRGILASSSIQGCSFVTVVDCSRFPHQLPVWPGHRNRMATMSPRGLEVSKVALMGFCNSPVAIELPLCIFHPHL